MKTSHSVPLSKRIVASFGAAVLGVSVASAEMTDLAGNDLLVATADELNASGYTNSSATCATLIFAFADACTAPTLGGNLCLVLDGGGTTTFPAARAYTGGTIVSNATLVITEACEFKGIGAETAGITLAGGTIVCSKRSSDRYRANKSLVVASGSTGTIVRDGSPISLYVNYVDFRKATLALASRDSIGYFWIQRGENGLASWAGTGLAKGGTFVVGKNVNLDISAGDCFGNGSHDEDITLRVCDGGLVSLGGNHDPLTPKVILEGGARIASTEQSRANTSARKVDDILSSSQWLCADFCRWVKVVPSETSGTARVKAPNVHLAPISRDAYFDIAEGAVFEVDAQLWPAHGQSGRSLRKIGKGTLLLKRPLAIGGPLYVDEGTVELAPHVMLGDVSNVYVADGARLILGDGSLWNKGACPARPSGFLSTADVWFDATTIRATEGAHVSGIRNLGTAGGSFEKFANYGRSLAPDTPTYTTNGINGLAALHFAGGSREESKWQSTDTPEALILKTYTNTSDRLTFFIVFKWDGWEDGNYRYYKWHGPISFCRSAYFEGEDNNTPGSCDIQFGDTLASPSFKYGPTCAVNPGLDGSPTAANALLFRSVRSGTKATAGTWWSDTYPNFKTASSSSSTMGNHDIQGMNLGGRFMFGTYANSTRMLKGWIGEVLVFSRDLSEAENAYVTAYLKRKWFNSTVAAVDDPNPIVRTARVGVAEGGLATLGMASDDSLAFSRTNEVLEATGPGALRLVGAARDYDSVTVSGGALRLNGEGAATSEATIWFDPSDASAVETNAAGRIVAVKNKGNLCGAFGQMPGRWSTPCPLPTLTNLNGLAAAKFDSNSALGIDCDSVANQNGRRQMVVYGVMRRDSYVYEGGKGKWGGPFSFYQSTREVAKDDYQSLYGLHYQEPTATQIDFCYAGGNITTDNPIADGTPFIFSFYAVDHDFAFGFETVRADDANAMSNVVWLSDLGRDVPTKAAITNDVLLLGGRLWGQRLAQWHNKDNSENRMWNGTIAEFISFDRQPSNTRLKELAAYLRKKWFNVGTGSATPPAWLTGVAAGSPEAGVTVKGGAALETEGETVSLPSLTLEDGATLARLDAVREKAGFALFDVTGLLSIGGSLTLRNAAFPRSGEVKIIGAGEVSGAATWTFVGEKAGPRRTDIRDDGLWYVPFGIMVIVK